MSNTYQELNFVPSYPALPYTFVCYIFTLHGQTTWLKLKGTAANLNFCSANSKAIQQANLTLAPLQLGMVALRRWMADCELFNIKRLACRVVSVQTGSVIQWRNSGGLHLERTKLIK